MPLDDHAVHWSNYLKELVRELPLHYPSWHQMPSERKAGVVAKIGTSLTWVPNEYDRGRQIYERHQQHQQKIYNGKKVALKERLQGLGSNTPSGVPYTDDEIMVIFAVQACWWASPGSWPGNRQGERIVPFEFFSVDLIRADMSPRKSIPDDNRPGINEFFSEDSVDSRERAKGENEPSLPQKVHHGELDLPLPPLVIDNTRQPQMSDMIALLNDLSYIPPNNEQNEPTQGDIVCNTSRWKDSNTLGKKVPKKVLHYFLIFPKLQRLYKSSHTTTEMTWNATKKCTEPDKMQHLVDGRAWKDFDTKYPDFAGEPRNVRLGLTADGFNPFSNLSVETIDVATGLKFNMRAMVLWTINDFPVETIDVESSEQRCPADVKHEVTAVTVAENDLHPPYQYPLRSKQSQSEQNSTRKPHLGLHEKSEAGCIPARILTNFIKASRIQIGPVPKLERHVRIRLPPWKSASTLLSREMPPEQKRGSWQILGMRMTEATGSRSPTPPRVWPYTEDEIMPWHGHSLPHLKAHELHRYRNAQKKGEAAHETSEQCSYGEREEGRNTIRKPLRHTYPVRQCRPGNVSPATSRPGNPRFVPRDSGKCCSDS
ncbi:reverse transcriptase domain-containing protein [Tanacetum coccineum]